MRKHEHEKQRTQERGGAWEGTHAFTRRNAQQEAERENSCKGVLLFVQVQAPSSESNFVSFLAVVAKLWNIESFKRQQSKLNAASRAGRSFNKCANGYWQGVPQRRQNWVWEETGLRGDSEVYG